jgi:Tfp pilus assembly protein PilV
MTRLNQLGDTMVEVLIAMIIVAAILAGAFAASSRSQKSTQQAQEHTVASKIAESQLEQLNVESLSAASTIYSSAGPYCFNSLNTIQAGSCTFTTNNVDYQAKITRTGSDPYYYTVDVTWKSLQGAGQDEVTLAYKVDKP